MEQFSLTQFNEKQAKSDAIAFADGLKDRDYDSNIDEVCSNAGLTIEPMTDEEMHEAARVFANGL